MSEKNGRRDMAMSTDVETASRVVTMPGAPPAFHVTAKPTGAICNVDCGGHVKGRRLYTQTGELVTRWSIGAEQHGRFMIDVSEDRGRRQHCHGRAQSG